LEAIMTKRSLLLISLLTMGCSQNLYFSDDEGAPRPGAPAIGDHPDELSLPYALGSPINLTLSRASVGDGPWSVVSDAPAVFAISGVDVDSSKNVVAHGQAMAEGSALLHMLDGLGHEHRAATVTVSAPDSAGLFPHGPLRVTAPNDSSIAAQQISVAQVLVGGVAVFPVAYFKSGQRLYGRGIAQLDVAAPFTATDHTTGGRPVNEWLFIDSAGAGSGDLRVLFGTTVLATLTLTAVPDTQLASLSLAMEPLDGKNDGDQIWVFARATDASGQDVYGTYVDWSLDGASQARQAGDNGGPTGDLYRFHLAKGGANRTLSATRGPLSTTFPVQAKDGYVQDTTYLGCSAAPGGRASPSALTTFLLLALAVGLILRAARRRGRF
jgi:hypothetical protein